MILESSIVQNTNNEFLDMEQNSQVNSVLIIRLYKAFLLLIGGILLMVDM